MCHNISYHHRVTMMEVLNEQKQLIRELIAKQENQQQN